jgi:hypothetical protein
VDEFTRKFADLGLTWLVDQLPEFVRGARLRLGTNDVALAVFPKEGVYREAEVFTKTREQALMDIIANETPLLKTAERLAQKLGPMEVHTLVYAKDEHGPMVFSLILHMPPNDTTGVLN